VAPPAKQQRRAAEAVAEGQASSFLQATLKIKEKELVAVEKIPFVLNHHDGFLDDDTRQAFNPAIEELERRVNSLRSDIIILHTSHHEIRGRMNPRRFGLDAAPG